jgi:hypothetical protein
MLIVDLPINMKLDFIVLGHSRHCLIVKVNHIFIFKYTSLTEKQICAKYSVILSRSDVIYSIKSSSNYDARESCIESYP